MEQSVGSGTPTPSATFSFMLSGVSTISSFDYSNVPCDPACLINSRILSTHAAEKFITIAIVLVHVIVPLWLTLLLLADVLAYPR